jgi:RHS repeat-associated protein
VVTTLAYDVRDRLLSSTVETAAGPISTRFGYDAVGNLTKLTLPDGSALANSYDAAHRLVAIADLLNNQINYTLDPLGDRTATQLSAGATLKAQHSASFDALGRLIEDIAGVGQTTSYAYDADGNPVKITDPLGRVTSQAFDALDRLVQRVDPAGGKTSISYSPQDRPAKVADPNGNPTDYVYDGFGDVIEGASPDAGKTIYRYDSAGNRVQRLDAAGAVTNYRYDALNRMTARLYPADASENVTNLYDQPGAGFGIGRLTKVTDEGGTLTRRYDERGNVLRESRVLGKVTLSTAYAYDAASRIAAVTYPSGWIARYTRDAMGRITAVAAKPRGGATLPVAGSIAYQPFGPLDGLVYGNGKTETRAYDLDYRLTALTEAGTSASRMANYGYDAADNVLSVVDNVFGTQRFGYDKLNRLSAASGFYGDQQFRYDAVGNRLRLTTGSATTRYLSAAHTNRLTVVDSAGTTLRQFGYSSTGNITSDRQTLTQIALRYNQDNRLASVENRPKSGGVVGVDYSYDGFGQRLEKKRLGSSGVETIYQYDLSGHLLEEGELAGGTSLTDYMYLGDRPIAMATPGGTVAFYETGLLDTPQQLTGASQGALWSAGYQPFGQTKILVGNIIQNLRFPGQYVDAETGYYHNGFREYDPTLGRYLETDPIGLAGGLNTYTYARGNPMSIVDRSGLANLNLFDPGSTQYGIENGWNPSGYYSVAGHGDSQGIGFGNQNTRNVFNADQIAKLIKYDPEYTPGTPIYLHACSTGKGPNSFAQQLANKLGVTVIAPTDNITATGSYIHYQTTRCLVLGRSIMEVHFSLFHHIRRSNIAPAEGAAHSAMAAGSRRKAPRPAGARSADFPPTR